MKAFIVVAVAWTMVLLPLAAMHVIGDTCLMTNVFYLSPIVGCVGFAAAVAGLWRQRGRLGWNVAACLLSFVFLLPAFIYLILLLSFILGD